MIEMLDTLTPEEAEQEKAILETDIIHQITEGIIDFGAPILGATTGGKLLVGDPIPYAPATENYGHGVPKDDGGLNYAVKDGESNIWELSEDEIDTEEEEKQVSIKV